MQTDATLLANNTQHYWEQLFSSACMEAQQRWHLLQACNLRNIRNMRNIRNLLILRCFALRR